VTNALVITIKVPISKTAGMKKADRNMALSRGKFMTKNLTNKGFLYFGYGCLNSQGSLTFGQGCLLQNEAPPHFGHI
jgi:hypothetical protein